MKKEKTKIIFRPVKKAKPDSGTDLADDKKASKSDEEEIQGVEFDSGLSGIVIEGKKNLEEMRKDSLKEIALAQGTTTISDAQSGFTSVLNVTLPSQRLK